METRFETETNGFSEVAYSSICKKKNSYTLLSVISKQSKLLSPGFKVLALSFNRIQSSLAVSPRPPALPKGLPLGCLLADRVFSLTVQSLNVVALRS